MKKTAVFFLLSIFLFNSIGYYLSFKVVQCSIKREIKLTIKKGLPVSELSILRIPRNELSSIQWLEDGKEMRHEGELFDVIRFTESEDFITYYCINDKQEEELFAQLDQHIQQYLSDDLPLKNNASKKIKNHIVKLLYSHSIHWQFFREPTFLKYEAIQAQFNTLGLEVNLLPPRLG